MNKAIIGGFGFMLLSSTAYAQATGNLVCDPTCRQVSTTNPTSSSRSTSNSNAQAISHSSSRSQATGSIAGTQVNAPITSRSQGGSASVTVINQTSASNRSGGHSGSGYHGNYSGGYSRGTTAATTASTTSDPPADPPQLGSPQLPLTENLNSNGTQTLRDVPEIVAPNINGGNPCLVGISGGGAGPGIGITLGIGYSDKGCERRNSAALLNNIGEKAAAIELMCDDDKVRQALLRAGQPCAADRARPATAPVATAPAPAQNYIYAHSVDPAIIRRQQEVALAPTQTQPRPVKTYPDWCYTASGAELRAHPECQPH